MVCGDMMIKGASMLCVSRFKYVFKYLDNMLLYNYMLFYFKYPIEYLKLDILILIIKRK